MKKTCTRCLNFTTIYLTRLGEILGFVSSLLLLFSTTINFSALVVPIFGMHCSGKSLNVHISHGGSAWKVINWLQSRWICHGRIQLDNFSSLSASSFLNATHTKKERREKKLLILLMEMLTKWLGRGVVFTAEMSSKCCELIVKDYRTLHKSLLSTRFDGEREKRWIFNYDAAKPRQQPLWLSKVATQSFVV